MCVCVCVRVCVCVCVCVFHAVTHSIVPNKSVSETTKVLKIFRNISDLIVNCLFSSFHFEY